MATTSSPSDVSDEEWAVAVPDLTLLSPTALQRKYDLRAVFNAVRFVAHTGVPWRSLPSDYPPWSVVESATAALRHFAAEVTKSDPNDPDDPEQATELVKRLCAAVTALAVQ